MYELLVQILEELQAIRRELEKVSPGIPSSPRLAAEAASAAAFESVTRAAHSAAIAQESADRASRNASAAFDRSLDLTD